MDSRCIVAEVQGLKDLQDEPGVTPKPQTSPGDSYPSSSWKQWYEAYQNSGQPQRLEWCRMLQTQSELWGFLTVQELVVRGFLLLGAFLGSPSATCYQLPGKPPATVKESLVIS